MNEYDQFDIRKTAPSFGSAQHSTAAKEDRPLGRALEMLNSALSSHEQQVGLLQERLLPYLGPVSPQPSIAYDRYGDSVLIESLTGIASRIADLTNSVAAIRTAVE